MKKYFTTLAPLRQVRRKRKLLLAVAYFLVVGALLVAIIWRAALFPEQPAPAAAGQQASVTDSVPLVNPQTPLDTIGEEPLPSEQLSPRPRPDEPLRWPLEGEVLTRHHEIYRVGNQLRLHVGVDLAAASGTVVSATWPGIVLDVREDVRLGLLLEIDHGGGYISRYANLSDVFFGAGEEVAGGEPIAKVGQTAILEAAEGAFLHFALYKDGQALDPLAVLPSL
ncbi:MAG: M23 family metallopeptidase [Dethiobacter sp.]|nr:M23 family metallopeptidase [Dethiobacter sp.]